MQVGGLRFPKKQIPPPQKKKQSTTIVTDANDDLRVHSGTNIWDYQVCVWGAGGVGSSEAYFCNVYLLSLSLSCSICSLFHFFSLARLPRSLGRALSVCVCMDERVREVLSNFVFLVVNSCADGSFCVHHLSNRSLWPCNRSLLPYNRSLSPYNRSLLPYQ